MGHVSRQLSSRTAVAFGLLFGVLASAVSAQTVPVPTVVVQAKAVGTAYELDGVIQPVKQSTVSAQASGRISVLLVKAGDKVRAGQALATIDDREALQEFKKAKPKLTKRMQSYATQKPI